MTMKIAARITRFFLEEKAESPHKWRDVLS